MNIVATVAGVRVRLTSVDLRADLASQRAVVTLVGATGQVDQAVDLTLTVDGLDVPVFAGTVTAVTRQDGLTSLDCSADAVYPSVATWPEQAIIYQSGARARFAALPSLKPGDAVGGMTVVEVITTLSAEAPWLTEVVYG
jgi:hypothetical protein